MYVQLFQNDWNKVLDNDSEKGCFLSDVLFIGRAIPISPCFQKAQCKLSTQLSIQCWHNIGKKHI